ncbi:MAG: alpha-glucosidase [Ruminococcaceae bacterium]|nr:alpha-glucosidase [Oscillospiraceae bacterium]
MFQARIGDGCWTLALDGHEVLRHTPRAPFITAVRHEKTYRAVRGSVKEQVREAERVPLTECAAAGENEFVFSAGDRRVTAALSERSGGVRLAFRGEDGWAYELRLDAAPGEAVFGGGEQYRKVNLRGETVVNFVAEHIKASTVLQKAVLPRALYREKPHKSIGSYAPMPVFVTDKGRLILFETAADGTSRFGKDEYRFCFDRCPDALLLARGADYPALARVLAAQYENRQYLPDWCFDGMILSIQGGTQTILDKAFAMLDAGAQVCGVWSQDWSGENRTVMGKQVWWNWEADETLYPSLRQAIAKLNARGVRFLAYINPYLVKGGKLYDECREKGWLITRQNGEVYHIRSTTFDAGMLDLTNPDAAKYLKDVLIKRNMLDLGVSGWMADFGEYLPVDCVLHDGDPRLLHNEWPVLWARLNREAIEEYGRDDVFFFMRSGYLGVQKYAPCLWNGDQHTDLTRDYGMPCVMPASFSLGFSGVPVVHCDAGGFFSFGKLKRDDELFIRWMEMCTFSLLMRSHESIRPWANAQFDAPAVAPHTVRLTNVHRALKPYLQRCLREAQAGLPSLRPDFYEAVDYSAGHDPYSYFLGSDLYVCPVIRRKAEKRQVWLPKGVWVHLWTGKVYAGGERHTVPAPLGEPPVFYRAASDYLELFRAAASAGKTNKEADG